MGEWRITILIIVTYCLFQGLQISKQCLTIFPNHTTLLLLGTSPVSVNQIHSFLLILRVKVQSTLQASKVKFQFKNALPTFFFKNIAQAGLMLLI